MNEVFMLYASCIIVKGYSRTTICDLQRCELHFIPNTLADLFTANNYLMVDAISKKLDTEDKSTFEEYLTYLNRLELGFFCRAEDIPLFPKLPDEWLFPGYITNCILDAEGQLWYFDENLLKQLEQLCCDYLQIRFFQTVALEHLEDILALIRESHIKGLDILLPKLNSSDFYSSIKRLVNQTPQLQTVVIHSDIENRLLQSDTNGMQQILLSSSVISGAHHCGIISPDYFAINIPHFTESLKHNTCVNRKIGIDKNGEIKNCPSMQTSYGNVVDTSLRDAIEKTDFKQMWDIAKDQITICKDCEFRHVCTDCRAYLDNPQEQQSKPLKCGYDPYSCTWEEWSINPLKTNAINYYQFK